MSGKVDRVVRWGLAGLIAFTPLAFGTVEPWAIAIMEWGIVTLALLVVMARVADAGYRRPMRAPAMWPLLVPVAAFLLLAALQTVPMPPVWLERLSPGSARMYAGPDLDAWEAEQRVLVGDAIEETAPALNRDATRPDRWRPVSIDPRRTWDGVRLVACLATLFVLVGWWARDTGQIVFLAGAVTWVGAAVALFGIVQYLTWNGRIYWLRRIPTTSTTTPSGFGPFVNHNHFAGFAEMVIPVAIGLAFWWVLDRSGRHRSRRDDTPGRLSRAILILLAVVVLVSALALSSSKGGILSAFVSGGILLILLFRRIRPRRLAWTIAVTLPILAILLVLWIGPEPLIRQLSGSPDSGNEASFRLRAVIWRHILAHLPEFLWTGSGLGGFEASFAPLTPPGSQVRWDKAHNDYLQILWETGLIGTLLVLTGVLQFVRRAWWPAVRQPRGPLDLFRLGLAMALLSIAIHSLVDFNLQIGANGFLCALLAGMLVALEHGEDIRADLREVAPGSPAQ